MAKIKEILTLKNGIEAQIMREILDEKKIPCIIRSYYDSAYDGIFQTQSAWGYIEALPEYAEEILAIYKDLEESKPEE